jgi:hypothetical protein
VSKRTYYGLRLLINDESLDPQTVKALGRICAKKGRFISYTELVDSMFGIEISRRPAANTKRIEELRYALDEVSELNPDLLESGDLDPVRTYGYRITDKATKKIDGGEHDAQHRGRSAERRRDRG